MKCYLKRNKNKPICIRLKSISKKDLSYKQAKMLYPKLKAKGDFDGDGVKNSKDCRPFNKKKQDLDSGMYSRYNEKTILVNPRTYRAFENLSYQRDSGESPFTVRKRMQELGYSDNEIGEASSLYSQAQRGREIEPFASA